MTTVARPLPEHGTEARYQVGVDRPGCRCRTCVTGWNRAHQQRLLAHLQGRPPKVNPTPVTAHIKSLLAEEMTLNQIADAANVDFTTVAGHARGAFPTIRRTTAIKILAVRPQQLGPTARVSSVGTRRRLQALYAVGHGPYLIAAAHGSLNSRALEYVVSGERAQVTVATRNAVADAYNTLAGQPGNSPTSRQKAAANKWPDPSYWEDTGRIDDPTFDPSTPDPPRYMRLGEDGLWLESLGLTREQAAERLEVTKDYLEKSIYRYRAALAAEQVAS